MVSFCLSTGIVVSCLVFYSRYFNGPISTDIDDWAGFATFCGFSLSLISIIFIFMTYRSQQELSSILQFESSFFQWLEMHNSIYNECKVDIEKYYDENDDKQTWFDKIKEVAGEMGYAKEVKEFKANPGMYKAHVGDVSTVLRVALTSRTNTPDMYEIMQVLGKDRIAKRFEVAKTNLK